MSDVDAHNRRTLWDDVASHLTSAHESVERAQLALEDLGESLFADQLQPFVDALRRAAVDAGTLRGA